MSTVKALGATLAATLAAAALPAPPALAAEPVPAPALAITSLATPTNFDPTKAGEYSYEVRVTNVGGEVTDGSPITITDTLPEGLTVEKVELQLSYKHRNKNFGIPFDPIVKASLCKKEKPAAIETVTCTVPKEFDPELESTEKPSLLFPAEELRMVVFVNLAGTIEEGDRLINEATVEGGGAAVASATSENEASAKDAPPGFAEFSASLTGPDGKPVTQAGSHPYQMTTSFALNLRHKSSGVEGPDFVPSGGDTRDLPVALPPGLIGNPTAAATCTLQQFNVAFVIQPFPEDPSTQGQVNDCPNGSAVGYITLRRADGPGTFSVPIYNLEPPSGMPAQFGFIINHLPIFIDTEVRPEDNYRIVAGVHNISEVKRVPVAAVTLWGTPADPRHDPIRGRCLGPFSEYPNSLGNCEAEIGEKPSLRLPSDCEKPLGVEAGIDTWGNPGNFISTISSSPAPTGCNLLDFSPTLEARPTTNVADSPSGLEVDLHIPQNEDPEGLGEADLRKAVVTLPEGLVLNPATANGLEGCSSAQIGRDEGSSSGFDNEPAHCPAAARIGTVEVDTPLLDEPLPGSVYVAMPHDNPFDSLLAIYIAVDDPERGVVVKLAGHVEADPVTGRLTTTFDENPQVPFEDFKLSFFGGAAAALRTPAVCGTYSTTSEMTPWSAPESGPPATPSDTYGIVKAPNGGPCPTSKSALPNKPSFNAGTIAPIAGAYSPLVMNLRREDGSQEFAGLTLTPPPGLLGRLAGIPYCPDAALAAAEAKTGSAEKAAPSCPAASEVGTVTVGAGAGPAPYYTQGRVYLAGPYKGAPLSLAIVTPATAGPYDIGTVVVRTALYVDPETAKITAVSDPIPHILQGIPLDVRSVAVKIDRPNFTLNPTNCDPLAFDGQLLSTLGQSSPLTDRFQVGECGALRFKPKLSLRLGGATKRGGHPALSATLTYPKGAYANIASAQVSLPHSEFLEQAHIRTICTRVQFAAAQCPAGAIYGYAKAITPLLDAPLEGPVYLRSSSHPLPDLVVDLNGQIHVVLVGRVDSVNGGIRTSFESVPDAPVSKFVLSMRGGARGLLVNSRNICASTNRASAKFDAQNGRVSDSRPALKAQCPKKHKGKKHHHRRTAR